MPLVALAGILISMGRIVRGSMNNIFPEINFDRLKAEASRWVIQYPCIRQVDFYQHRGGKYDADKRYLIDIVANNDTSRDEMADLDIETQDMGGSTFFEGLMHAQSGEGLNRNNWEIYVRRQSDDPPVFLVGERWPLYDKNFSNLKPYSFDDLNINSLQAIAAKWVEDYNEIGAVVQSITIHPMGMPIYLAENLPEKSNRPKYAVIFHCPDCERKDLPSATDSTEEHLRKVIEKEFSPYTDLFLDLQNKSKHLFYNGNLKLYQGTPPENWLSEWRFVLKYTDNEWSTVGADISLGFGLVLFPITDNQSAVKDRGGVNCTTDQTEKTNEATPDKVQWSFNLNGPVWDVMFGGETGYVVDCTPVRRMLRALERPDVKFSYILLSQIAGGTVTEPDGVSCQKGLPLEDNLLMQDDGGSKPTEKEIDTMTAALGLQYKTYLENQEKERDRWLQLKSFAKSKYGLMVTETVEGLNIKKSRWTFENDPQLIKARKAISKNRREFLDRIKHIQGLHEHMTKCLKIKNGIIYTPPEGSPTWQIR
jgi:hypothetical protein